MATHPGYGCAVMMTPAEIERARHRVIERLAEITVVHDAPIEDTTEIYKALRVSGWDLSELLGWVHEEFGTDFSAMNISQYSPAEGAELFADERDYRGLTVGALVSAMARGAWSATE